MTLVVFFLRRWHQSTCSRGQMVSSRPAPSARSPQKSGRVALPQAGWAGGGGGARPGVSARIPKELPFSALVRGKPKGSHSLGIFSLYRETNRHPSLQKMGSKTLAKSGWWFGGHSSIYPLQEPGGSNPQTNNPKPPVRDYIQGGLCQFEAPPLKPSIGLIWPWFKTNGTILG